MSQKYLFIDRDGTLITEPPEDFQVDRLDKLALEPDVIPALLQLQQVGFQLVMVTNQDGLGTASFPQQDFEPPHQLMLSIFQSQGINFKEILICPHLPDDHCQCRKPNTALVTHYLADSTLDKQQCYVIGDRQTDLLLAENMGIQGILYQQGEMGWSQIAQRLTASDRFAEVTRTTKETAINVKVWLDRQGDNRINTGLSFFDHMLDQIATHGGIRLHIAATGDLVIDDHHTVEDTALSLGEALRKALGDKRGIERFGFVLPMDEAEAHCSLDLSGRPYLKYSADFNFQRVGDLSTEMIEHFFQSFSYAAGCTLHLSCQGKNDHHRAESLFKAFARTVRQAVRISGNQLPSSKGVLV